jgi:hypothetical protein
MRSLQWTQKPIEYRRMSNDVCLDEDSGEYSDEDSDEDETWPDMTTSDAIQLTTSIPHPPLLVTPRRLPIVHACCAQVQSDTDRFSTEIALLYGSKHWMSPVSAKDGSSLDVQQRRMLTWREVSRRQLQDCLPLYGHATMCPVSSKPLWQPLLQDDFKYRALLHFLHQLQRYMQMEPEVVPVAARLLHAVLAEKVIPCSTHAHWVQWGLVAFMIATKHESDILDIDVSCVFHILRDMNIHVTMQTIQTMELYMMQAVNWIIPSDPTIDCITITWRGWRLSRSHQNEDVVMCQSVEKYMESDVIALYLALIQHPLGIMQWWTPMQVTHAVFEYSCEHIQTAEDRCTGEISCEAAAKALRLTARAVQTIMKRLPGGPSTP